MSNNVYASYNGSQLGFTVRDLGLDQTSFSNLGIDINSIASGENGDVYLASKNHLYHYKADGTLITDMTFPDESINYTSVIVHGNRVYASYSGSQLGVTVRNLSLKQLSYFETGFVASGIAAGNNEDIYLASENHIYRYGTDGNLIKDMNFPISTIIYTDVTVLGDNVYASYKGSQQGVTVRDINLEQLSSFNTGVNTNSIAAGPNNNVYLASANHIYNYTTTGELLADMNFPDDQINYTGISVVFATTT